MEGSGLGYREEGLDLVEAARVDNKVYERVPDMGGWDHLGPHCEATNFANILYIMIYDKCHNKYIIEIYHSKHIRYHDIIYSRS